MSNCPYTESFNKVMLDIRGLHLSSAIKMVSDEVVQKKVYDILKMYQPFAANGLEHIKATKPFSLIVKFVEAF